MKLGIIGLGQAGGKVLDTLLEYESRAPNEIVVGALAVNSAQQDLMGLKHVREEHQILIGQSRVKGHGVGADNELGASIAEEDSGEVLSGLESFPLHKVDAFLLIAGLGGGTGSGSAPVIARKIKQIYSEPVYGLGILPADDEGGIYTLNAARSFQTFIAEADNVMLVDNDSFRGSGNSVSEGYSNINNQIAERFGTLFSAGEIIPGQNVAESVVDASEIINTLGSGGVSTLGYAKSPVEVAEKSSGLLSMFKSNESPSPDTAESINRITSLTRQATLGQLTLPVDVGSAERALVIISGPPEHLSRKGIEASRRWLEDEAHTMEVRGGDFPIEGASEVSCTVLLSGTAKVPRIKKLQQVAIETSQNIDELRKNHDASLESLVNTADDSENNLEPLF